MKSLAIVIALVALLGLMVYSNPSMDDFGDYVRQKVVKESRKETRDPLGHVLGAIVGGVAGGLVISQTVRTDYVIFSTYELQFGKERLKVLGLLKNFIVLEKPSWIDTRQEVPNER